MKRYCLALDLVDNPKLIEEYEELHKAGNVPQQIQKSITTSGIINMEIYRVGNRMFMIIDADDSFSLETKAKSDLANPDVQEWETLMWKYQQALPWAMQGEKWILMKKIFQL